MDDDSPDRGRLTPMQRLEAWDRGAWDPLMEAAALGHDLVDQIHGQDGYPGSRDVALLGAHKGFWRCCACGVEVRWNSGGAWAHGFALGSCEAVRERARQHVLDRARRLALPTMREWYDMQRAFQQAQDAVEPAVRRAQALALELFDEDSAVRHVASGDPR